MNYTKNDGRGNVEGFFLVAACSVKMTKKAQPYLDMVLCDPTGEINAVFWEYDPEIHGEFNVNTLVKIRGNVSQYNGSDQLRIERIRRTSEADGISISDFVPSTEIAGDVLYNAICEIVESFEDTQLKDLCRAILSEEKEHLLFWPAAFKLHHAVRGGLLYHTLSVARLCESICKIYPFIRRDLLLSGAILHDIGKVWEFQVGEAGIANDYSIKGNLLGHLYMGALKIDSVAKQLGVDEEKSLLVQHMLISHHGDPEFGAAVRPMFIEAEVLSQLDCLDATIYEMGSAIAGVNAGEFTGRQWALDNRKLYNHGLEDTTPKAKLI
ncbi:MAG: HD domain-containing protein [Clostridia bacterium]|nr:HD domain-containing protein [Clostridia bacterium]